MPKNDGARGRLVVVDDSDSTDDIVRSALGDAGFTSIEVLNCWQRAQAAVAAECAVLLVEAQFRDGRDCRELVYGALRQASPPAVIVMSANADRRLIADLAFAGVSAYLEKPLQREALRECIARAGDCAQLYRRIARLLVGRIGLKEAQWYLRGTMNREALRRANGSCRAAAHILRIDRRYVARLADEFREAAVGPEP